jgi:preprotein translocase subunit SecD
MFAAAMPNCSGKSNPMPAHRLLLALLSWSAAAPAQAGNGQVTLEVRVATPCSSPTAGRPVKDPEGAGTLCLDRTQFLSTRDVESTQIHRNAAGRPVILLTFHSDAAIRELQVTKKNIGNRVGIVLNGRLVSAPRIWAASRLLFIDGNFTQPQAEALVKAFNRQAATPNPSRDR